jgi:hypothetical protein
VIAAVLGVIAFSVVVYFLTRNTVAPPEVQTIEALLAEDYTPKQAKAEQRKQRAELRSHTNMQAHSLRSASQVGRFAVKVAKIASKGGR